MKTIHVKAVWVLIALLSAGVEAKPTRTEFRDDGLSLAGLDQAVSSSISPDKQALEGIALFNKELRIDPQHLVLERIDRSKSATFVHFSIAVGSVPVAYRNVAVTLKGDRIHAIRSEYPRQLTVPAAVISSSDAKSRVAEQLLKGRRIRNLIQGADLRIEVHGNQTLIVYWVPVVEPTGASTWIVDATNGNLLGERPIYMKNHMKNQVRNAW